MTSAQAGRVVLVCGGVEAAFVLARAKQGSVGEEVTVKSLWAIGLLTLSLSIFSDFVPEIAGPFALLVLVAMAARSRGQLGQVLGVSTAPLRPATKGRSSTQPASGDPQARRGGR